MPERDVREDPRDRRMRWLNRIGWFIGLWLAGVAAVGAVAALLRLWIA